jgi:hypothetical protein
VFFTTPEILPEGAPKGWTNTQSQVQAQLNTNPTP